MIYSVKENSLTHHKKVIDFPSPAPPPWTFLDFGYANGSTPIQDWYDHQISNRARFSFDALIKNNEKMANHQLWSGVEKQMQGIFKGHQVWQWRSSGEVQYRMLGAFNGEKRAVFLMGYYHKGNSYTPAG